MATTPTYKLPSSFPHVDMFSSALMEMIEQVEASIVQVRTQGRGGGTGIIWDADKQSARILTNNHVVASDNARVQVIFLDGRKLEASVLDRDPQLDLALLQVSGENLKALEIGDSSELRIGEWVFAIGHPWGQPWVVTAGILSSRSVYKTRDRGSLHYLKSDVRLAPGNSGGPLLNADGHVVGINSMIFGGDLSISIPSNVVTAWLAGIRRKVRLGIEIQAAQLPEPVRQQLQPARETGVLIVGMRGRPQQLTDLLIGDILLDVANQSVTDPATLRHVLSELEGETVEARILRGGELVEAKIALIAS